MSPRVLLPGLLAAACLYGQIGNPRPGQYPPGQYPPGGGYPPGQYPPGQYPGDQGGVGLPIPGRGGKKNDAKNTKAPLIKLTGKVAKQDGVKSTLTVETDDERTITFRVTGDTKITGESGKLSAADLKVGDELSIQAHTDDKGFFYADTIRLEKSTEVNTVTDAKPSPTGEGEDHRPILRRAGSGSEGETKTADKTEAKAENTTEAKAASAPKPAPKKQEDEYSTGEEHPILPSGGVASNTSDDPDRPVLRRGGPAKRASTAETPDDPDRPVLRRGGPAKEDTPVQMASAKPPAANDEPEIHSTGNDVPAEIHTVHGANPGDETIQKAREAAFEFNQKLPNFVCQQFVARYQSETKKPNWQALDVVQYDLVYEDGKEQYKNPKINGKAVKAGADKDTGSWSTGEFGTLLQDLFHPATAADFKLKGQTTINHRSAKMYSFTVDKEHSHWRIQGGTQWIMPAYKGTIWIDRDTYRALRIEMEAVNMPAAFVLDHTESAADYDFVSINDRKILLPTHAEVLSCERGTLFCSRNAIDFRNYHAYTGDSSITFGN